VPRSVLEDIVGSARWAGSFLNIQPWEFAVLGGEVMREWKERLVRQHEAGNDEAREVYAEMPLPAPYDRRGEDFVATINNLMFPPGTANLAEKQHAYTISGIHVRDAPNAIVVCTEKSFIRSTLHIIGIGIVVQNVCLAAMSHGLGTCVMGRPVEKPRMLRELLGIPESKAIPCVIAIGYPDATATINTLPRKRLPVEEWVHWHGC
jgi:nitroreductase